MTTSQHASIRHACLITSLALAFGYAPPRARRGVVAVAASHAFGEREFWRNVYRGETNFPAEEYSWYCGYAELAPFWNELVPRETDARDGPHVLVVGVGNDPTAVALHDAGWTKLTCFDYAQEAVERAREMFGAERLAGAGDDDRGGGVTVLEADATALPRGWDGAFDAVLDKGTLDALAIAGGAPRIARAAGELKRAVRARGVVVCLSRVADPGDLLASFDARHWECLRDGALCFAPDGESSTDLGALLFAWRRRL